jgi:conjugative relaxase-like TrwC/TraI family protein
MLSIAKIHCARSQARGRSAAGYAHYLGRAPAAERSFEGYARGFDDGPAPFWACSGSALLGLAGEARGPEIELLARGFHPATGKALARGAGDGHVMGLDLTFSAPKDVSAIFAGADEATRAAILGCMREATRAALGYAESAAVSRHGAAGAVKRFARAAVAACFTHFASRALDPQLHIHSMLFNLGLREGADEWGALEQRGMFDRKLAMGALWRAELAQRLAGLGFGVEADGPYFKVRGVSEAQRDALSSRAREIDAALAASGSGASAGSQARAKAARATRGAKAEPPLAELLASFAQVAGKLGITPASVAELRACPAPALSEEASEPALNHEELLERLTFERSCATAHEALALICEHGMGRWGAAKCLQELSAFMSSDLVERLGPDDTLAEVFTSKALRGLEERVSARVRLGADRGQRVDRALVDAEFDRLERGLRERLGVAVSLSQQREAAAHAACDTGAHAFIEGWAGSGKTTALGALAEAFRASGQEVRGCCQSASAALNLQREAGIPSRTIASLLLALRDGRAKLTAKTVLVLDEAGMVGSREFALLQEQVVAAGAKLVCVGDSKQLQPIEAGGIFASLSRIHGKAELSQIRRQRTDMEPLLAWLDARAAEGPGLDAGMVAALRALPDDARLAAMEALCARDPRLSRAFERWRARYDFEWMRQVVQRFAVGDAAGALNWMDERGRLRLAEGRDAAMEELISAWEADRAPLSFKAIIAATKADADDLNRMARERLIASGAVRDAVGAQRLVQRRDGTTAVRRFAPGDRVAFLANDPGLGVTNGACGTIAEMLRGPDGARLRVELDEPNARGETALALPASFAAVDWGYASTNHRAQGRTFDTAHALASSALCDREWAYVAASRSRFATTIYADAGEFGAPDPESHLMRADERASRQRSVDALAARMSRSRAKVTSLDFGRLGDAPRASAPSDASPRIARRVVGDALSETARRLAQRLRWRHAAATHASAPLAVASALEPRR